MKFIIDSNYSCVSGVDLEHYLIDSALSTVKGSMPFNRGYGSLLSSQIGNKQNNFLLQKLILECWFNPVNCLSEFNLISISINNNSIGISYDGTNGRRDFVASV